MGLYTITKGGLGNVHVANGKVFRRQHPHHNMPLGGLWGGGELHKLDTHPIYAPVYVHKEVAVKHRRQ